MRDTKEWVAKVRREEPPELWSEVLRRAVSTESMHDPARGHRVRAIAILAATVVVLGAALYGLSGLGAPTEEAAPQPAQLTRYRVDGAPQPLAVGSGAAWVDVTTMSSRGTGPSMIWRIDAQTGETKPLPETTGAVWTATGDGQVWVTRNAGDRGGPGVLQLNPDTGDIEQTVALHNRISQIAVGLGSVWVSTEGGLVKIDTESGTIVETFPGSYNFLGTDGTTLWATTSQRVVRLDPSTGKQLDTFPFPDPCYFDVNPRVVFVATCASATLNRDYLEAIDTQTSDVLYRVPRDGWGSMRLAGDVLLVAQNDPANPGFFQLVSLDPATGEPTGTAFEVESDGSQHLVEVFSEPHPFLSVGEGSAWFTDFGAGEIIRVALPLTGSGMPTPAASPSMASPT